MTIYKSAISLILFTLPITSLAYENPDIFCSVNDTSFTKLSCAKAWTEIDEFPEVNIQMKDCFGFKSSERLRIEIDGKTKTFRSVVFPFKARHSGYTIKCRLGSQF